MSLRALGRQFIAQRQNRDKPWIQPSETFPQGHLFAPWGRGDQQKLFTPQTVEAARRHGAGEKNPQAPWREPHWSDKLAMPQPGARTTRQSRLFE